MGGTRLAGRESPKSKQNTTYCTMRPPIRFYAPTLTTISRLAYVFRYKAPGCQRWLRIP